MTRSTVQSCPAAPFPTFETIIASDSGGQQPVVEQLDRGLAERARTADEPIAVGAVDVEIEQADEARIVSVVEMMAVHKCHADALRRGLKHQWPQIEIVDPGRFQIGHADRFLPLETVSGIYLCSNTVIRCLC